MSVGKTLFLALLALSITFLAGCGAQERECGSGLAADAQIVFMDNYIAYITEDTRVFLITPEDETGGYIPDIDNVRKIFGGAGSYLFLFLENGSFRIYNLSNRTFMTEEELQIWAREIEERGETTGGYPSLIMLEFLLKVKDAEDAFCIGTDFAAAYCHGKWEGSYKDCQALQWENIVKFIGLYEPDMGLREDGTVILREQVGDDNAQLLADKIGQWTNVVDIAEGSVYFGLLEDGTVVTPQPSPGYAADVAGWRDIHQIAAAPYVTAGLTDAGRVLIRSPYREEIFQAQEWENVCYICATSFSVLGITEEGKFLMTPAEGYGVCLLEDAQYPPPGFLER